MKHKAICDVIRVCRCYQKQVSRLIQGKRELINSEFEGKTKCFFLSEQLSTSPKDLNSLKTQPRTKVVNLPQNDQHIPKGNLLNLVTELKVYVRVSLSEKGRYRTQIKVMEKYFAQCSAKQNLTKVGIKIFEKITEITYL